jgi:hypothetical protein
VHKSIVKRIRKIETQTYVPRWRVVVKDTDGLYRGECGQGLTEDQFQDWAKTLDFDTQVIIVEVNENEPASPQPATTFRVENLADKNTKDLLVGYEDAARRASEANIIAADVSDEYSEEEKNTILEAHRIIRHHRPVVAFEGMH